MPASPPELIFDDRLATVLATTPGGHADARTQYRQLLDLLGRTPPGFDLPEPALVRLTALEERLSPDERAALVRASQAALRHPGLILRLASQAPIVAAAAIGTARLDDWQWTALAIELPLAARGHLRQRTDLGPRVRAVLGRLGIMEIGLPAPAHEAVSAPSPEPLLLSVPETAPATSEGIGAIVRRIEAFRRSRKAGTLQFGESPQIGGNGLNGEQGDLRLPLSDEDDGSLDAPALTAIRFVSDARGCIVSADAPFAAMLAGFVLGQSAARSPAQVDGATARALRQRRPIHAGRIDLTGAEAISGGWQLDAVPRFAACGGRFIGYQGVMRRPNARQAAATESVADRLRQLLHELRTPVNAIQGFAELIQQQLFGPTPHQYRSLAASIAADSAAILAGFEEIDRLVRFETGRADQVAGQCDIAQLIERMLGQMGPALAARNVKMIFAPATSSVVGIAPAEAERTLWRVLALLASAAGPGETLALELGTQSAGFVLAADLPTALAGQDDMALFAVQPVADGGAGSLGFMGGGFALRLARAELSACGGSLSRDGARLLLRLPGLTTLADANSAAHTVPSAPGGGV
jgi:two-component system OmpR family sensor kinase